MIKGTVIHLDDEPLSTMSTKKLQRMFETNFFGVISVIQAFVLLRTGHPHRNNLHSLLDLEYLKKNCSESMNVLRDYYGDKDCKYHSSFVYVRILIKTEKINFNTI